MNVVQKFCDQCGVGVPAGSRFCGSCGHQLSQPTVGLLPGSGSEGDSETLDSDALNPVEQRLAQQKAALDRFENGRWSKSEAIGKGMSKRDQRRKTKRELVARGKEARKKEKARKEEARKKEKARSNKLLEEKLEELQKKRLNEAEAGWGHWERVPKVVCSHCGTEGSVSKYVIPTIDTLEDGIARMFSVGPTKGEMLGQEREALRKKEIPGMKCENCTVKWNV